MENLIYPWVLSLLCFRVVYNKYNIKCLLFKRNIINFTNEKDLCAIAAHAEDFLLLKFLRAKWNTLTMICAAETGNVRLVQWLRSNGCPWNHWVIYCAARNGVSVQAEFYASRDQNPHPYLSMLKYFRKHNRCPGGKQAVIEAAANGNLDILKLLLVAGFCSSAQAITMASQNGHLKIIKFLREKGCSWNSSAVIQAARNRHPEIVKWLVQNGCPCTPMATKAAFCNGCYIDGTSMYCWLYKFCPWDPGGG